jgi:signal transduction histidine kinase
MKLLLIEDDRALARLLAEQLKVDASLELTAIAETLADGIAKAQELGAAVDVVILDLNLPDSEGVDTVAAFNRACPRLPVVVLSGERDVHTAVETTRNGAQDYIVKGTIDAESLRRSAEVALERKRLIDIEQMLVGVVSHDLRTPLHTVTLGCELLLSRGSADETVLKRMQSATRKAEALVNDLLDATRLRRGGSLALAVDDLDLKALVETAVDEHRMLHPTRHIDCARTEAVILKADGRRLGQVVQNLLGNALQHSPPNSSIALGLERGLDRAVLVVHNENNAAEPPPSGLGLGLFIVDAIVKAHGGTILHESTPRDGTTVRVSLPI